MKMAVQILFLLSIVPLISFAAINPNEDVLSQHAQRQQVLQNNINSLLQAESNGESDVAQSSLQNIRNNLLSLESFGYRLRIDPAEKNDRELKEEILVAMSTQQVRWNVHACLTVLFISCGLKVGKLPEINLDQNNDTRIIMQDNPGVHRVNY